MTKTYIGITVGPIYDTIRLSSTPAALWTASYLFSHIVRRICEEIVTQIPDQNRDSILSPYFGGDLSTMDNGIGVLHDRVIFETQNPEQDFITVQQILTQMKQEISDLFEVETDWMKQYLQLHAVAFPSERNPILDSALYLDAAELEKTFPDRYAVHPLLQIFNKKDRNAQIRKFAFEKLKLKNWPFPVANATEPLKESMADLQSITGKSEELSRHPEAPEKPYSYYAIVQSDGDHFGQYIASHADTASRQCMEFCTNAAKEITAYGGIPLYAGGDDLLFLAPLWEQPNCKLPVRRCLLDLLLRLKENFYTLFKGKNPPTISFGVAVRYIKYPLYETFDESYDLLFHQAKRTRNAIAISLIKHSGQGADFLLNKLDTNPLPTLLSALIAEKQNKDDLKSIPQKIAQFQPLFELSLQTSDIALKNAFDNTFDHVVHKEFQPSLDKIRELLQVIYAQKKNAKASLDALAAILRFVKFYSETGKEDLSDENNSD